MNDSVKYKTLLTQKQFLKLLIADVINRFGDSIDSIAYSWVMYQITGSLSLMALIIGLNYIPTVLLQPFAGIIVDKINKRKLMALMDIGRGLIVLLTITLYLNGILSPILLIILTLSNSILEAFRVPASMAFVPLLLDKEFYTVGKAASFSLSRAAELVGLIFAGGIIALAGTEGALMIDVITFFLSALLILLIKIDEPVNKAKGRFLDIWNGFKDGIAFIKVEKRLLIIFTIGVMINFCLMSLTVFQTPYVSDYLLRGPETLSLMKISMVVGMGAGAAITPKIMRLGNRILVIFAGIMMGAVISSLSVLPYIHDNAFMFVALTSVLFLLGAGGGILNIIISSSMMRIVPQDMMGRIGGLISSTMQASMPLSSFICSILALKLSILHILLFFGVLSIVLYAILSKNRMLHNL